VIPNDESIVGYSDELTRDEIALTSFDPRTDNRWAYVLAAADGRLSLRCNCGAGAIQVVD
jgi:hypothetical protein